MSIFDGILDFIEGGGGGGGFGGDLLSIIFDFMGQLVSFIRFVLSAFWEFISSIFTHVFKFFAHIWDGFFKRIFTSIFHAVQRITDWLEEHLRPIIDWLKKARKYILDIYTKYVKPVLIAIQRIRQFLSILKALHVKWAEQLDAVLAKVQSDINAVFLKITGTINAIIDVLNIVTDPTRLLRHPILLLSVRRVFLALIRQLTGLPSGFFFPSPRKGVAKPLSFAAGLAGASGTSSNPPPSFYFMRGDAVPVPGLWESGVEIPDAFGDDMAPLDYFLAEVYPLPGCSSPVLCFLDTVNRTADEVRNG